MLPKRDLYPDVLYVMNIGNLQDSRFVRGLAIGVAVLVALTGSQQLAMESLAADMDYQKASIGVPIVATVVNPVNLEDLAPQIEEVEQPIVKVPSGLSLKQAISKWKKLGSPLAEDIAIDAPYEGAPRTAIVDFARNFAGTPYVFTGATPYGFDCSGYIRFVYSHFGLLLPHGVRVQADSGMRIKAKHAKPGDLVIWNDRSHSGIYVGDGKIIHATKPGGIVSEVDLYTDKVFYVRLPVGSTK